MQDITTTTGQAGRASSCSLFRGHVIVMTHGIQVEGRKWKATEAEMAGKVRLALATNTRGGYKPKITALTAGAQSAHSMSFKAPEQPKDINKWL